MQVIIMFLSSKTVDNMGGISDVLQEMCQYLSDTYKALTGLH